MKSIRMLMALALVATLVAIEGKTIRKPVCTDYNLPCGSSELSTYDNDNNRIDILTLDDMYCECKNGYLCTPNGTLSYTRLAYCLNATSSVT